MTHLKKDNHIERKKVDYSKVDVIKLDTKCLYAGKLERIRDWKEEAHSHPFCEVLYILSGSGEISIFDTTYKVKKGDIVVYNANVTHCESSTAKSGIEIAYFGITNFKISDLPPDCLINSGASPVLHTKGEEDKFAIYFRSLVEEVYDDKAYSDLIAKYWARLILIGILRLSNVSEAKFFTNAVFSRIYHYLSNNFADITSMDNVCEDLSVSKYYLAHVFKKYMGVSPMQYVTSRRIAHAKRLLEDTDLTASEIGAQCGYKDHVLFFKTFKKLEGKTPIEFRKASKGPAIRN